ncbi:glycoside hydrolase family 18 protein [Mycena amicta]|nr:glycoside hydrolase family 18 protein [Mycena amicta]
MLSHPAWYPGWLATDFPPSSIPWDRYNAMTFAFATTTSDPSTLALDDISAQALPDFVSEAKSNGSIFYSSAVASAQNRTAFVNAILDLVSKYDLDGIDFDWEYPGRQGLGCNVVSPDDSANFPRLLTRTPWDFCGKEPGFDGRCSASLRSLGMTESRWKTSRSLPKFSDRIAIMNYDVWGSWSPTVGPNAPLNDTCAPSADQQGSAVSAVKAWTAANFPANQIALGLASYGHSFSVAPKAAIQGSSLALYPTYDASAQPMGSADSPGDSTSLDPCGNPAGVSGIFTFAGLVQSGFLNDNGTGGSRASSMFSTSAARRCDSCAKQPFVYNQTSEVMVSYDDATSFGAPPKDRYINAEGLAGFAVWDVTGDQDNILLDSLHQAMGIVSVCQ